MTATKPAPRKKAAPKKKPDPDPGEPLGLFGRLRITFGTWSWDGAKGQWTRTARNRRRKGVEFHGRTRAERAKDRKAKAARKLERDQAAVAKRWARDRARAEREQQMKDRAEDQTKVTQTGAWSWPAHAGPQTGGPQQPGVVRGEVLQTHDQLAITSAQECGQPTQAGGRCRNVGACPHHSGARGRKPAAKRTTRRPAPRNGARP